jgi:predicted oxidoreductase (fatty acid repression mutant protein)
MAYRTPFLEAIKVRRSILSLAKESPISDDRIVMCVNHAIKHAPSPFNVQSCRAIVLFGAEHEKLWDIGMEESRKNLPPPVFAQYESKIQGFRDAYGTVSQSSPHIREQQADHRHTGSLL